MFVQRLWSVEVMRSKITLLRFPGSLSCLGKGRLAGGLWPAPVVATIGNFDGLHKGHQKILARMREYKNANPTARSVVISFYPHPAQVLGGAKRQFSIVSLRQKITLLDQFGVDGLCLVHFTKARSLETAAQFLESLVIQALNVKRLIVGPDARVGHRREGDTGFITRFLRARGAEVEVVEFLKEGQVTISSRGVRSLIEEGRVAEVQEYLARPFVIDGPVRRGDQRGRTMGFPTANLLSLRQVLPALGVYGTTTEVGGVSYRSVTNVGFRPTFGEGKVIVESHLLDYGGPEFYGQQISVQFSALIRPERKFDSIDELARQISADCETRRGL